MSTSLHGCALLLLTRPGWLGKLIHMQVSITESGRHSLWEFVSFVGVCLEEGVGREAARLMGKFSS